jgi:hypothetical protein
VPTKIHHLYHHNRHEQHLHHHHHQPQQQHGNNGLCLRVGRYILSSWLKSSHRFTCLTGTQPSYILPYLLEIVPEYFCCKEIHNFQLKIFLLHTECGLDDFESRCLSADGAAIMGL